MKLPSSPGRLLLFFLIILLLGAAGIGITGIRDKDKTPPHEETKSPTTPTPTVLLGDIGKIFIIYANSIQGSTQILAQNAQTEDPRILASLPDNVKHINVTKNGDLIYIDGVNKKDHGKTIKKFIAQSGKIETLAKASDGFGIDDVVVSTDGTYISWWEVQISQNEVLLDGYSKIFVKKIEGPKQTVAIIENTQATNTTPIHYPLFFDAQNRLYLDTFIPNQGNGFYLGMSYYNPSVLDANLTPISNMDRGDYVSDPEISQNGKNILFVSSDRKKTDKALSHPNQLGILDLTSFQKRIIVDGTKDKIFMNPKWSDDGTKIAYQSINILNPDKSEYEGIFVYDLISGNQSLVTKESQENSLVTLLALKNKDIVWGVADGNDVGNLGRKYSRILSSVSETNIENHQTVNILSDPFIQYIGSTLSLAKVRGIARPIDSLQLGSFIPKVVAKERKIQQNKPQETLTEAPTPIPRPTTPYSTPLPFPTQDPNAPRCGEVCDIPPPSGAAWTKCVQETKCYDSPMYLYPEKETPVEIRIEGASIFSDYPPSQNGLWKITARPDGTLIHSGKAYDKITYGYFGKNVSPPQKGFVVNKNDLSKKLEYIGKNLGLKNRELNDFISFWKDYLPSSPYYFISFYPKKDAEKIISYSFDPTPDSFLQIIMYFRPISAPFSVSPPDFPKFTRHGFTAVDWSGIVDK